jgi:hypothetical protein
MFASAVRDRPRDYLLHLGWREGEMPKLRERILGVYRGTVVCPFRSQKLAIQNDAEEGEREVHVEVRIRTMAQEQHRRGVKGKNALIASSALIVFAALVAAGCRPHAKKGAPAAAEHAYVLPAEIALDFGAERGDGGQVFIVGTTNLPDGTKLGAEVFVKHHLFAQDFDIFVSGGRFRSAGFSDGSRPIPPGNYDVHMLTYFNEVWQSPDILRMVGRGGANLKGNVIKFQDPDVIDSDKILDVTSALQFPPLEASHPPTTTPSPSETGESKAIALVKRAMLTVDGSRSATDIEENIALFMKNPELRPAAGWTAKNDSGAKYAVSYSFINGKLGEEQAIWEADIATKKVRYINKNAKYFSWTPAE